MAGIDALRNSAGLYSSYIVSANHALDGTRIMSAEDPGIASAQDPSHQANLASACKTRVYMAAAKQETAIPQIIINRIEFHVKDLMKEHDIPGMAIGISTPSGDMNIYSGVMNKETGRPIDKSSQFMLASVTKTYTAVMIMQMVQEGKLALDDRLSDPKVLGTKLSAGIANADKITVAQLLQHTAGLTDVDFAELYLDNSTSLDSVSIVRLLHGKEASSMPGESFEYSNAGYSLLGEILKHVDGMDSITEVFEERIARKLDLQETQFGLIDSKNLSSGYVELQALPESLRELATASGANQEVVCSGNVRFENTGLHRRNHLLPEGGVVTNLPELQKFMRAFFDSELIVSHETRRLMQGEAGIEARATQYPVHDDPSGGLEYYRHYGLGLNLERSPDQVKDDPDITRMHDNGIPEKVRNQMGIGIGHSGTLFGYQTDMKFYPKHKVSFAMLSNAGLFQVADKRSGELKNFSLDFLLKAKLFRDPMLVKFLFEVDEYQ